MFLPKISKNTEMFLPKISKNTEMLRLEGKTLLINP